MENKKEENNQIVKFLHQWTKFPIDYWWRKRYNIPFGSLEHRNMSFIDMLIDYMENVEVNKMLYKKEHKNEDSDEMIKLSQGEIDEDYENLDLENFKVD